MRNIVDDLNIDNHTQEKRSDDVSISKKEPNNQQLITKIEGERKNNVIENYEDTDSKMKKKQSSKESLCRATVDMLRELSYDWELDYFGFNICAVDTALLVKDEFLRHVEQKLQQFEINDSNWDSEIVEYGKACETIVNKYRPMGVAEMLKPVLFSRLSGEKANAIKSQKSLNVNDVVEYLKSGGGQKNNYLMIAEDFVGVFRAQNKILSDSQKKAIKDFVYLADSKPKDLITGILANAVTKDKYKLDFDYFENNWRGIDQFLRDHRNKIKSVDAAMNKPVDGSISNGKVSKNSKNTSLCKHSLKLDPLFSDIIEFLREKYGVKFINTHVFRKVKARHKKNLCVACGTARNHDWKSCKNSDLRKYDFT